MQTHVYSQQDSAVWADLSLLDKETWSRGFAHWRELRAADDSLTWDQYKELYELVGPDPYADAASSF